MDWKQELKKVGFFRAGGGGGQGNSATQVSITVTHCLPQAMASQMCLMTKG